MRTQVLAGDYGKYMEHDFRYRWLRPSLLREKLEKFRHHASQFRFEVLGQSIEGRPIEKVVWGSGGTRLLLWSQMHGNEPTATMAIIDLFNFLSKDDDYNYLRDAWAEELEIHFIPMLNPDGSERFSRRNALNVDPNRDAARAAMPETRILLSQIESLQPHWAFNLHDQRNIFSAGAGANTATISFLAASSEQSRAMTSTRQKSMQLISQLYERCEEEIPRHCGRYTDEFYPRAIGDHLHKIGVPCVLIESGAYVDDPFRDMARKLNFLCLSDAFSSICFNTVAEGSVSKYQSIPENQQLMLDILIRRCSLKWEGQTFECDLGLLYQEYVDNEQLQRRLILSEIGDLQFHHGIAEWEGGEVDFRHSILKLEEPVSITLQQANQRIITLKEGILQ